MPRVKGKSRLQTGSPGSESCSSTHNPEVGGSNPPPATTHRHVFAPVRFSLWRCSSVVEQGTHKPLVVGSNPSAATLPPPRGGIFLACKRLRAGRVTFQIALFRAH